MSTHLFCTSDPRQCDGREEAKQKPSRAKESQGEAAKLAEEGARARDHHNNELVFRPKKARVKQIQYAVSRFPPGMPRLCCCGPVMSRARPHSHRGCPCACNLMHEGYDPLVDAAPPFHIRPRSSNPAQSRTHSSTTRARPTGGKTASARNPRCQEIWQVSTASSTDGGMSRYPPKLPPLCVKTQKPRKYHAVRQFPPVAARKRHPLVRSQRGGSMQLPDPFPISSYPT